MHRRRIEKNEEAEDDILKLIKSSKSKRKRKNDAEISSFRKNQRTRRSTKRHPVLVRDDDGGLREIRYTETFWYRMYLAAPPRNDRLAYSFRL